MKATTTALEGLFLIIHNTTMFLLLYHVVLPARLFLNLFHVLLLFRAPAPLVTGDPLELRLYSGQEETTEF